MNNKENKLSIGTRLDWIVIFSDIIRVVDVQAREAMGVNVTQCRILFNLSLFPEIPVGSIATSLSLKASTTTASVNSLESKGFVTRRVNDADKRSICLELTPEGKEHICSLVGFFSNLFNTSLSHLHTDFVPVILEILSGSPKKMMFSNKLSDQEISHKIISHRSDLTEEEVVSFLKLGGIIENMCYFCCKISSYDHARSMTPNDSKMLRALGNLYPEAAILRDISSIIGTKPNVTTVCVKSLQNKGYINRVQDKDDKRAAFISLSDKGVDYLLKNNEGFARLFDISFPTLCNYSPSEFYKVN